MRLLFCFFICFFCSSMAMAKSPVAAYLRVKNEIKTIEASLNSIDGIFDKIVIIHSNEKDDGTLDFMNDWCQQRSYCQIHEYPFEVVPSHDQRYKTGNFKEENTLASYYNFGLQFFDSEDWIVKIDADQVYLSEELKAFVDDLHQFDDKNIFFGLKGYNTFSWNNIFVKFKKREINGGFDSFVVKKKYIRHFKSNKFTEDLALNDNQIEKRILNKPMWFHFMKSLKSNGVIQNKDEVSESEVSFLSENEQALFNDKIRPLLKNSPYFDIKFEK